MGLSNMRSNEMGLLLDLTSKMFYKSIWAKAQGPMGVGLYTVQSIMRAQNFLTGLGLGLGLQFIYLVGYEFPTKGSSLPGILAALFNPRKFLPSLF